MMFRKLGILHPEKKDVSLVDDLLSLMQVHKADYTQVFLALQQDSVLDEPLFEQEDFQAWRQKWKTAHLTDELKTRSLALMEKTNPKVIARNHWVENALEAAVGGNMKLFDELLTILSKPYAHHGDGLQFQKTPAGFDAEYQTFCGT